MAHGSGHSADSRWLIEVPPSSWSSQPAPLLQPWGYQKQLPLEWLGQSKDKVCPGQAQLQISRSSGPQYLAFEEQAKWCVDW
jgi:hypothetical protein